MFREIIGVTISIIVPLTAPIMAILAFYLLIKILQKKIEKSATFSEEVIYKYHPVEKFLDHYEDDLYRVLVALFHEKYLIFAKPRVEDIINANDGLGWKEKNRLRGYIKSRHVDFVLCDRITTKPIVAIELDGSSHNSAKGKKRDQKMNDIYASTDMRYVHIPIAKREDREYITRIIVGDVSENV